METVTKIDRLRELIDREAPVCTCALSRDTCRHCKLEEKLMDIANKTAADEAAGRLRNMPINLISIDQAVKKGIKRLRKPIWANPLDHFEIDIIDGKLGPWLHLYAPFNKECNGRDPVDIILPFWCPNTDIKEFEIYEGPLPDSQEYQREVTSFEGVLKKAGQLSQTALCYNTAPTPPGTPHKKRASKLLRVTCSTN